MSASPLPACGSDRAIVPNQRPSSSGCIYVCCCWSAGKLALQIGVADGQKSVARRAHVGRLKVSLHRLKHHPGQLQTAQFFIVVGTEESGITKGIDRRLHAGHELHLAVLDMRLVHVSLAGMGGKILVGHVVGEVQHIVVNFAGMLRRSVDGWAARRCLRLQKAETANRVWREMGPCEQSS